jgi:peptide chain release factor subunit 1
MVNDVTTDRLRSLAGHHNGPVLSVFLDLDPSTKPHPPAREAVINSVLHEARHAVEDRGLEHESLTKLRHVLEALEERLQPTGLQDGVRGLAAFGPTADGVDILRLPAPVQNHVCLDAGPHLEPLVPFASNEHWCVALVDRSTARFYTGTEHDLQLTGEFDDDVHGQHDQGGWSQRRYEESVEQDVHHHLDRVARALHTGVDHRQSFDRLILGGQGPLRSDFEHRLHPYVRGRLAGWIEVDLSSAGVLEILQASQELMGQRRRAREKEALDRLQQGVAADGHAVHGADHVLDALNEQRVETLLLTPAWHPPGAFDPQTGMLATDTTPSVADGLPMAPADDLAELAIAKAYEQDADVLVLDDPRLQTLGGVGAVTRF